MFKRVTGTKDILPQEASLWQETEERSRRIFSLYNYQEIRPPLIEAADLFNRSLGQASEIVQKQMFLIERDKDTYCLRPEGTASVVRAYIENNLDKAAGLVKLYYTGAMFRAERPQKGRLRQFHHLGAEIIGTRQPAADVEIISLADRLLKESGIDSYKIKLNSLGCVADQKKLTLSIYKAIEGKIKQFCPDCQARFKHNVLRVLDCKNEGCKGIISGIKIEHSHLCPECAGHFWAVKEGLGALGINYEISAHLVRGLDYYTRTVFEITHSDLGAQDALGAGGRYDNLVKELGGPDLGAMGFAFGVERLLLVTKSPGHQVTSKNLVYIITLGEEAKKEGIKILETLRKNNIACDTDYEDKSLKGAMRKANDLGAKFVLILGDDELKKAVVMLKDMASGEQQEVSIEQLIAELKAKLITHNP